MAVATILYRKMQPQCSFECFVRRIRDGWTPEEACAPPRFVVYKGKRYTGIEAVCKSLGLHRWYFFKERRKWPPGTPLETIFDAILARRLKQKRYKLKKSGELPADDPG